MVSKQSYSASGRFMYGSFACLVLVSGVQLAGNFLEKKVSMQGAQQQEEKKSLDPVQGRIQAVKSAEKNAVGVTQYSYISKFDPIAGYAASGN